MASPASSGIMPSPVLTKHRILAYLDRVGESDARSVGTEFGIGYSVAAMRLLRLVRQGLAVRRDVHGVYRYRLSERGQARLAYLEGKRARTRTGFLNRKK